MNTSTSGWINGLIGVIIFSASLPATRLAVADFDPLFLTAARASIAGLIGACLLWAFRQERPTRAEWRSLAITAFGVVLGFPLFTALALQTVTSAHSTIFVGLLPVMTAIFGVLRSGERPHPAFWIFACLGSLLVAGYALLQSDMKLAIGDAYMLCAIIVCGLGYAEGAKLSRRLGGWQVISWALVLSLPFMLALAAWKWPGSFDNISAKSWGGLIYVSLFSMLIGFIFWYRGLAQGGIASVGQLQLLQPLLSLMLAASLLGETVTSAMLLVTIAVIGCVFGARKFA